MSHSFSFSHCITLISKSLHFSWCPCWFNRWRREVCSCFHCFCCFFKAAGSSVEIEAFPLFYYSRRRRRRHSFSFFGFGKALCLETTFAISQLLPTHQGNFRNLLSLASSFLCKLATVNCSLGKLRCICKRWKICSILFQTYLPWEINLRIIRYGQHPIFILEKLQFPVVKAKASRRW